MLLIEVHDEHVQALLCDDECDWATETDAVLAPIGSQKVTPSQG